MPVLNIQLATHPPETMNVLFSIFIALLYPGSVSLPYCKRHPLRVGSGQTSARAAANLQNLKLCLPSIAYLPLNVPAA